MREQVSTVKDLGEQGLIKLITPYCDRNIVGDDGAVIEVTPGHQLVVTTDVLVDGVHFSDRTTDAYSVGYRSAAANLSDLAAMGATPLGITVGLSLPGDTVVSWVGQLYQGLAGCLSQFSTSIIGGDITRSQVATVAITALGEAKPKQIISRSSAQVGDAILISGYHGLSRAGLELLLNPPSGNNTSSANKAQLIKVHQKPQPRLDVIKLLREIAPDARVAGMDSSDGLGDAIAQICRCSNLGATIDFSAIPIAPALAELKDNYPIQDWILDGGEDFELVLALEPQLSRELLNKLGEGAAIIGTITEHQDLVIDYSNHIVTRKISDLSASFQHFG